MCRSEFSDHFADARGFGWDVPGEPKFHWKTLIQEKVQKMQAHFAGARQSCIDSACVKPDTVRHGDLCP